eukprot:5316843-Pyramimonas_sp.AAC.1
MRRWKHNNATAPPPFKQRKDTHSLFPSLRMRLRGELWGGPCICLATSALLGALGRTRTASGA